MMHAANELEVQALLYAHSGSWVEALATYESLVAQACQGGLGAEFGGGGGGGSGGWGMGAREGMAGIAQALRGLGAQRALSAFAGSPSADGPACPGQSVAAAPSAHEWGAASLGGGAGLADRAEGLRAWSPTVLMLATGGLGGSHGGPHASLSSSSYPSAPSGLAGLPYISNLAQRGAPMVTSHTGGPLCPSLGASATLFLGDSITQVLLDTQRRDVPSAQRRVRACSQRLFPVIAESLQHETIFRFVAFGLCICVYVFIYIYNYIHILDV